MISRPHRLPRAGAILSMELLLVLPILILFLLAIIEITQLISAETRFAAASREGARVAALGGGPDDVQAAIERILGSSQVNVVLTFLNDRQNPGDSVQVAISAPADAFVPNYLRYTGFDMKTQTLAARTVMTIE